MDDCTLYALLPDLGPVSQDWPPPDEMLENCKRFIKLRHCPHEPYVSPQRRIEELEAVAARLRAALAVVAERHLIPVPCDDGWCLCVPTKPLTVTAYPAAATPEGALLGALLGAQAEIEGRAGK
jgi:hypothetical protein